MQVRIKSYHPYNICFNWYGNLIGKIINVKKESDKEYYTIDDKSIETTGTILDSYIHEDDIEILNK